MKRADLISGLEKLASPEIVAQMMELVDAHTSSVSSDLFEALQGIKVFVDNDFPPKVEIGKRSPEYTNAWHAMNKAITDHKTIVK